MDHPPTNPVNYNPRIICAVAGIVILESVAMLTGHNGTLLRVALVAVAGLGGFSLASILRR
jgi:hypothetical protein